MTTWLPGVAPGTLDAALALRPDLGAAHGEFTAVFATLLTPAVHEACRIRVAQVLGRADLAAGEADPERVAAVARWWEPGAVSADEAVVLSLAEQFVLDPHGVTAEQRAAVRDRFGEAGLVAVVEWLALLDGIVRFQTVLGLAADTEGSAGGADEESDRDG